MIELGTPTLTKGEHSYAIKNFGNYIFAYIFINNQLVTKGNSTSRGSSCQVIWRHAPRKILKCSWTEIALQAILGWISSTKSNESVYLIISHWYMHVILNIQLQLQASYSTQLANNYNYTYVHDPPTLTTWGYQTTVCIQLQIHIGTCTRAIIIQLTSYSQIKTTYTVITLLYHVAS